jgi:hypothetical protein
MLSSIGKHYNIVSAFSGIIYMTHKSNTQQNIEISDLFIGYKQNTGNLILYGLVITILAYAGFVFCLLPGLYVLIAGFVGLPIVFFGNKNVSDGISLSFKATNDNFGLVLVVAILGFLNFYFRIFTMLYWSNCDFTFINSVSYLFTVHYLAHHMK